MKPLSVRYSVSTDGLFIAEHPAFAHPMTSPTFSELRRVIKMHLRAVISGMSMLRLHNHHAVFVDGRGFFCVHTSRPAAEVDGIQVDGAWASAEELDTICHFIDANLAPMEDEFGRVSISDVWEAGAYPHAKRPAEFIHSRLACRAIAHAIASGECRALPWNRDAEGRYWASESLAADYAAWVHA